ncbi:MAG: SprT family zinc-dependent metalloprotease [Fusobacterium sp.]|uniref:M48 family metallopeptidase n=1 Tax=Fusobacterium sp. TaxID=68766 RepID=UPI0026DA825A|nr:SprT family zinc-dependent metalloprotease [Fusobacterium sp.]MDO4690685.1 SprT family zinc-dependent metalloprotease [Fusobacterium sp.]
MNYKIIKKKIKSFIIRIYPDKKIIVSVPYSASSEEIEAFLEGKKDWINKSLKKLSNKDIETENNIILLGKLRTKRLIKSEMNMIRLSQKNIYIYHKEDNIENSKINSMIEEWKKTELDSIIREYIEKYTFLLNTQIKTYKIKKMSSAWGIYHTKNNYITFNYDLIKKDKKCIEYVVLHELCHIFFQNHKKEFWNLVENYMSDYKMYRKLLKQ